MSKMGKIILWSVIAVILTAIMIWGIIGGTMWNNAWSGVSNLFSSAGINVDALVDRLPDDAQTSETFEADATHIKRISLQFVDENVMIVASDDAKISAQQTSNLPLEEDEIMHYGIKGEDLLVQSGRVGRTIFQWPSNKKITVTLSIPKDFNGILEVSTVSGTIVTESVSASRGKFDTTSGNASITGGTFHELRVDSVSGEVEAMQCTAQTLDLKSMSGNMRAEGDFEEVNTDSTSGTVDIICAKPEKVDADSTSGTVSVECEDAAALKKVAVDSLSGDVRITLPENDGFQVQFDTVSGGLSNEFAMRNNEYKDGGFKIDVNTTSGSLDIAKN